MPQGSIAASFSLTKVMYLALGPIPTIPQEDSEGDTDPETKHIFTTKHITDDNRY
jgi:hypothetical protein